MYLGRESLPVPFLSPLIKTKEDRASPRPFQATVFRGFPAKTDPPRGPEGRW